MESSGLFRSFWLPCPYEAQNSVTVKSKRACPIKEASLLNPEKSHWLPQVNPSSKRKVFCFSKYNFLLKLLSDLSHEYRICIGDTFMSLTSVDNEVFRVMLLL